MPKTAFVRPSHFNRLLEPGGGKQTAEGNVQKAVGSRLSAGNCPRNCNMWPTNTVNSATCWDRRRAVSQKASSAGAKSRRLQQAAEHRGQDAAVATSLSLGRRANWRRPDKIGMNSAASTSSCTSIQDAAYLKSGFPSVSSEGWELKLPKVRFSPEETYSFNLADSWRATSGYFSTTSTSSLGSFTRL